MALKVGQRVRHYMSGWEGDVAIISDEEACGQGRLVTVEVTSPPPPEHGGPWGPITVTEAELVELSGQPS